MYVIGGGLGGAQVGDYVAEMGDCGGGGYWIGMMGWLLLLDGGEDAVYEYGVDRMWSFKGRCLIDEKG